MSWGWKSGDYKYYNNVRELLEGYFFSQLLSEIDVHQT